MVVLAGDIVVGVIRTLFRCATGDLNPSTDVTMKRGAKPECWEVGTPKI